MREIRLKFRQVKKKKYRPRLYLGQSQVASFFLYIYPIHIYCALTKCQELFFVLGVQR